MTITVCQQPTGRGGSGHGSGRVRHGVGRVGSDNWLLKSGRVGSGPDPGGSGRVRKIGPGNNSARALLRTDRIRQTLMVGTIFLRSQKSGSRNYPERFSNFCVFYFTLI